MVEVVAGEVIDKELLEGRGQLVEGGLGVEVGGGLKVRSRVFMVDSGEDLVGLGEVHGY